MTRGEEPCGCAAAQGLPADSGAPLAGNGPAAASLFSIPKMDCPAEEGLIRLALKRAAGLVALEFDLGTRELRVLHDGPIDDIASRLGRLGLGAHMKASWIFSTNDVPANLGVIVAGMLVAWTGANTPDPVVVAVIAVLVLNGARRILKPRG